MEREERGYTEDMIDYLKSKLDTLQKKHAAVFADLQQQKEGAAEVQENTSEPKHESKKDSINNKDQVVKVKSEQPTGEMKQDADGAANSSGKKRKHDRIFSDPCEEDQYRKTIETFVKTSLALGTESDSNPFISTTDLTIAFEKTQNGNKVEMGIKFLKELKQQIALSFGKAVVATRITTQQGKSSGYAGIVFQAE